MTEQKEPALENPSPFQRHLGYQLKEWRDGFALLELKIAAMHMNRSGVPHGGLYASLLDAAMGYAGCFPLAPGQRRLALTLTLTTQFLSRPKGKVLLTTAQKTGGGRSVFFADAKITDETGELIAMGSASMKYRAKVS